MLAQLLALFLCLAASYSFRQTCRIFPLRRRISLYAERSSLKDRVKVFNTPTRKNEHFVPSDAHRVTFYSCGPTVYDYAHIGNFRAFITYDIIKRWLQYCGYEVNHVCNLTDVDDKIINKMLLEQRSLREITEKYTRAFFEDLDALNIIPARLYPKATEHISEIETMVDGLVQSQHAYVKRNSVYFRTASFPTYTEFARLKLKETLPGAGESGPHARRGREDKESEQDFVLWKASTVEDAGVSWGSRFGSGRPGWHIECSAMCRAHLGETIDLHAGGVDLVFPHHSNEVAQSECATGKPLSRYWIHNAFININNEKMSKSLGNFKTLRDIVRTPLDARAFRFMVVTSQYRTTLSFTEETFRAAKHALRRVDRAVAALRGIVAGRSHRDGNVSAGIAVERDCGDPVVPSNPALSSVHSVNGICERTLEQFEAAMCDDLNGPRAAAALFQLVGAAEALSSRGDVSVSDAQAFLEVIQKMDEVFGVLYEVPASYVRHTAGPDVMAGADGFPSPADAPEVRREAEKLAVARVRLKLSKQYQEADVLREKIKELGFGVRDVAGGFELFNLTGAS